MLTLDPRSLVERAIEVMRQSAAEPRVDGKTSPLVGAVLWKRDGTVETASRDEMRSGDHAEYTLLERKNRDCKHDGAVLFATLEPCAPGSRQHPKLGCAECLVLARIREVWMGIADPDPTVDRKGIKYLQGSGVSVGPDPATHYEGGSAMRPHPDNYSNKVSGHRVFTRGSAGVPTVIPTKCRDVARSSPCGGESRHASRPTGRIRVWIGRAMKTSVNQRVGQFLLIPAHSQLIPRQSSSRGHTRPSWTTRP